ncbi:hypothetical protein ACYPKM_02690 [Pseudomonas aeruginosa]
MISEVQNDLAKRVARIGQFMGLDVEDEELLWRHLNDVPPTPDLPLKLGKLVERLRGAPQANTKIADEIREVLEGGAVLDPVEVICYSYTAVMPERFYNDQAKRRAMVGVRLKHADSLGSVGWRPFRVYVRDLEVFRKELLLEIRTECFKRWYDSVTACQRPNGVDWEPPTRDDIEVDLQITAVRYREKFGITA